MPKILILKLIYKITADNIIRWQNSLETLGGANIG